MRPMSALLALLSLFAVELSPLDPAEVDRIAARVWPEPTELSWETIPWIPAFGDGLERAAEAQKPVLLWVMNGHPLGCT